MAASAPPPSLGRSGTFARTRVLKGSVEFTKLPDFRLPPADHPFDHDYDSNTALWLVTSAVLVYSTPAIAENVVKNLWGMPEFKFFDIESTDTQAMGFCNDDFIILAFRGTESKADWSTNLDAAQVPLSSDARWAGINVHKGFDAACNSVLPEIEQWLDSVAGKTANPSKPLYIGGHSLGGALATLCYAHFTLRENPISVNGVVTIGQPRVGTPKFVNAMNENGPCVLQRIFNINDVVPTVPPNLKGYHHYGNPIYFNAKGELIRRPSNKLTRRDKTKAWAKGKSGVAAHGGPFYLSLVRAYDELLKKRAGSSSVYKAVITVHRARGLKAADSNGLSDPYPLITYHGSKFTGPVVEKTLNPDWDNVQLVIPEIILHDQMEFELWDSDNSKPTGGDFLGHFVFSFDDPRDEAEVEVDLLPRPGKKDVGITGTVTISTQFFLLRGPAEQLHAKVSCVLHGARNLLAADASGTSDPYARIYCGSTHKKTKTIMKTLNPDWEFPFILNSVAPGDCLYIDLWDHDANSRDDFLGQAIVEFDDSFEDCESVEIELEPRGGKKSDLSKKITGHAILSFTFEPQSLGGFSVATGTVTVHGARELKAADSNGYSDPYCIVKANGKTHKTPNIKKTLNPSWELSFPLDKTIAGAELIFEVWDHDTVGSDDFIGQVVLKFASLMDLDHEWFSLSGRAKKKDRNISGDICLSFKWTEHVALSLSSSLGR